MRDERRETEMRESEIKYIYIYIFFFLNTAKIHLRFDFSILQC